MWLFLPSSTAVQQRMAQEMKQEEAAASTASTASAASAASVPSASGPAAAAASNASSSSSPSFYSKGGGAGGGDSSGLVAGALPRLLLLCVYLICTCVSQGFLMVAMPLFLTAAFGWGPPVYAALISARACAAFAQMMILGRVVPRAGGHLALACLVSVVGAVGALLSVF